MQTQNSTDCTPRILVSIGTLAGDGMRFVRLRDADGNKITKDYELTQDEADRVADEFLATDPTNDPHLARSRFHRIMKASA